MELSSHDTKTILQMNNKASQRSEEAELFGQFLLSDPNAFRVPIQSWESANDDPPDVIVKTPAKAIGVEITQWTRQAEMDEGKRSEQIELKLEAALDPPPVNTTRNIELVVYSPRERVQIPKHHYKGFRDAMLSMVAAVDGESQGPRPPLRSRTIRNFGSYPLLREYIEYVQFAFGPERYSPRIRWILPAAKLRWYTDEVMLGALEARISRKVEKSRKNGFTQRCDEYVLIVCYDLALAYCSPIDRTRLGLDRIVERGSRVLQRDSGLFSQAFLFIALEPGARVKRLL